MHVPDKWQMGSLVTMQSFIDSYGFALLISADLQSSNLPLLLAPNEGEFGVLYGHFARTNSHWKQIKEQPVLVVFNGPHAYISPTWYASSPAVPTWNYATVQVQGNVELTDDAKTADILAATIAKYEPSLTTDNFIPDSYKDKLSKGIVGFKLVITAIEGKEKLGQHRSAADQQGVTSGLEKSGHAEATELLTYMNSRGVGLGR
ncbi:FMN-binding negative transcriptional regulator [Colwelliaceae bacterium BS250]